MVDKLEEAMEIMELEVENRTTLRKKVKALRRSGITPANIFGHAIYSSQHGKGGEGAIKSRQHPYDSVEVTIFAEDSPGAGKGCASRPHKWEAVSH